MKGLLLTVDIEKAVDSVNHNFLLKILESYHNFIQDFLKWISVLVQNQKSCVINGGKTTCYFLLTRGVRHDDPVSTYIFILVLEMVKK